MIVDSLNKIQLTHNQISTSYVNFALYEIPPAIHPPKKLLAARKKRISKNRLTQDESQMRQLMNMTKVKQSKNGKRAYKFKKHKVENTPVNFELTLDERRQEYKQERKAEYQAKKMARKQQ